VQGTRWNGAARERIRDALMNRFRRKKRDPLGWDPATVLEEKETEQIKRLWKGASTGHLTRVELLSDSCRHRKERRRGPRSQERPLDPAAAQSRG